MARKAKEDGIATEQMTEYGHNPIQRKIFAGGTIPDHWDFDGGTEGKTDEEESLEREKALVESGQLAPESSKAPDAKPKEAAKPKAEEAKK